MDIIGQNGNDGYHYQFMPANSYVRLVAMDKGSLLMDYHAGWDGSIDVLYRARALIDSLIEDRRK